MDRKLKERIIGLVVLLTIAVLFLPMMLGGPDDSERSVRLERPNAHQEADERELPVTRMDLREQEEAEAETPPDDDLFRPQPREEVDQADEEPRGEAAQARGLDEQASEPQPSETGADDSEPEASESEPRPEPEPEPEPELDEEASVDEIPSGSGWAAQVGSFADRDNAEGLVSDLREAGFQSFLMRYESETRVLYRVRVGLEPDRDDAQALADRIREQTGHEAAPVPHP